VNGVARARPSPPRVCVVGAGSAALEGLLSIRALAPEAQLSLVTQEREFCYRSMTETSLFSVGAARATSTVALAAQAEAALVADRADVVHEADRQILTRKGDLVDYDYLLLAPGARSERTLRQGEMWGPHDDPSRLAQLISDVRAGGAEATALVVPAGARWPISAYELALVLGWSAADTGARITLITAEARPLDGFGPEATESILRELRAAGIELVAGVDVADAPGERRLQPPIRLRLCDHEGSDSELRCDRLIALPTDHGPRIGGVPRDGHGFVEVDERFRVCGSDRIWAAGECLATPLAHSGLASRQAHDAAADIVMSINADDGAPVISAPQEAQLTGILLIGRREQWLADNPVGTPDPSAGCLWWPPSPAVGVTMAGQIAHWDRAAHDALPGCPDGLVIQVPMPLRCGHDPHTALHDLPSAEIQAARLRDIEARQWTAVEREERQADAELNILGERLHAFGVHEQQVVHELRQHGYLVESTEAGAVAGRSAMTHVGELLR
jgi:sulfide:quinone oxidoreductase